MNFQKTFRMKLALQEKPESRKLKETRLGEITVKNLYFCVYSSKGEKCSRLIQGYYDPFFYHPLYAIFVIAFTLK